MQNKGVASNASIELREQRRKEIRWPAEHRYMSSPLAFRLSNRRSRNTVRPHSSLTPHLYSSPAPLNYARLQVIATAALNSGSVGKSTTGVQFFITNPTDSALVNKVGGGGWSGSSSLQSSQSTPVSSGSSSGACYDVSANPQWSCSDEVPSPRL